MTPWLIAISKDDDFEEDLELTTGTGRFRYDPAMRCGTLREADLWIRIYGQDFDSALQGLIAYDMMRVTPLTGTYPDLDVVAEKARELLKSQLADYVDWEKLVEQ